MSAISRQPLECLDVSRETLERLECYAGLLRKWNPAINLVSKSSIDHLWERHFEDSAQIFSLVDQPSSWVDLGSGGGFPGLVVAIIAAEKAPDTKVSLVESDQRKAVFLRAVLRETGVSADVISSRIEAIDGLDGDVVSARALAELSDLLEFANIHLTAGGTALFPKGRTWEKELVKAQQSWSFDVEVNKSRTEPGSVILKIQGLSRV